MAKKSIRINPAETDRIEVTAENLEETGNPGAATLLIGGDHEHDRDVIVCSISQMADIGETIRAELERMPEWQVSCPGEELEGREGPEGRPDFDPLAITTVRVELDPGDRISAEVINHPLLTDPLGVLSLGEDITVRCSARKLGEIMVKIRKALPNTCPAEGDMAAQAG